ncbi:hypothetical protein MMYC01_209153 [Madurella mycetomatis]|uniref:Uncharacterized protein n=1 Tax=Madurella mycetomatis TaxID=100816 RepID=A0A175VT29_9PEZI|nr:hypothetical protein MMYC01_209153 [Madurella mycetomatis]
MSKDAKDLKHRHDTLRHPHRRESFSSVLSWAVFPTKIAAPRATMTSSTAPQSSQASPGSSGSSSTATTTRPRRHSHAGTDVKTKARRGSTTFRRFSFSIAAEAHEEASAKTRHAKTPMNLDTKAQTGAFKTGKSSSSEKDNKSTSDNADAAKSTSQAQSTQGAAQGAQEKPRSTTPPMPKSILRVSSPDGYKRPRQFVNPETGEPLSPGLPPASPASGGTSSPPGSPPMSPVSRPMSPGTTVRFAKATIHRVEVGPGRRFLPVKRKSKSTLTYISPLDPGTQKSAPKTMLQSPTKMRRHQENQAAMGRYWLRTEEEEAQWRAEAERRAEEEAERYRNEPASPPPGSATPKSPVETVEEQQALADKIAEIDKLPRQGLKPNPDKLEEEEADASDSDTDEEAGADCDRETAIKKVAAQNGAEVKSEAREVVEDKTDDESEEEENDTGNFRRQQDRADGPQDRIFLSSFLIRVKARWYRKKTQLTNPAREFENPNPIPIRLPDISDISIQQEAAV